MDGILNKVFQFYQLLFSKKHIDLSFYVDFFG